MSSVWSTLCTRNLSLMGLFVSSSGDSDSTCARRLLSTVMVICSLASGAITPCAGLTVNRSGWVVRILNTMCLFAERLLSVTCVLSARLCSAAGSSNVSRRAGASSRLEFTPTDAQIMALSAVVALPFPCKALVGSLPNGVCCLRCTHKGY